MKNSIVYCVRLPIDGKFPEEPPKDTLERILQESFKTRDMEVVSGYFIEGTELYPKNLSFLISPYHKNGEMEVWMGSLIATSESVECFEFTYYDKIGVIPIHQRNGLMTSMIKLAREVSHGGKTILPAVLRTSSPELDGVYAKESDIKTIAETVSGNFYIHGFGFLDKETNAELFKDAKKKFILAAEYVGSKPRTVALLANNQKLY